MKTAKVEAQTRRLIAIANSTCGRLQRDDFLSEARSLAARRRGHPELKSRAGNDANDREHPEGGAPAKRVADRGRARHADEARGGEAQPDEETRRARCVGRNAPRRHDRRDAEEGGVRNRREHPRAHQPTIIRRERSQHMTDDEDRAELQERPLARLRGRERDNDRAADGHADRIAADEQARLRDADVETGGDVRQQADDRELGRPDGESRQEEREQQRRHGDIRRLAMRRSALESSDSIRQPSLRGRRTA